jgi:hypothetical protein
MRAQDNKGRNKNDFFWMCTLYVGDHSTLTKHVCRSEESDGGKEALWSDLVARWMLQFDVHACVGGA